MKDTEQTATPDRLRIQCADLSLRCPGFDIIKLEASRASVEALWHLEDRSPTSSHGKLLSGIYGLLCAISDGIDVFVREKAFSRFPKETQAISKVVGIADQTAWQKCQAVYHEIAPTTIKKMITGSGKASKQDVADSLERYVGKVQYRTDDESDAVAVGIAWLIGERYLKMLEYPDNMED